MAHATWENGTVDQLKSFINTHTVTASIISSVIHHDAALEPFLRTLGPSYVLNSNTPVPITVSYQTPETLGNDRLANAVAVSQQFPQQPALAIDMGTCIKYDFVTANNEYLGGAIAPGFAMRLKALHTFTDKLPLIEEKKIDALIGDSTKTSMQSGVYNGIVAEINGIIEKYAEQYPEVQVVLTGGDVKFFDKAVKNTIFADSFLTPKGLNAILQHNVAI